MARKLALLILLSLAVCGRSWAAKTPAVSMEGSYMGDDGCFFSEELKGALKNIGVSIDRPPKKPLVIRYFIIGLNSTQDGYQIGTFLREDKIRLLPHETVRGGMGVELEEVEAYRRFPVLKFQIKPSKSYRVIDSKASLSGPTDRAVWWSKYSGACAID